MTRRKSCDEHVDYQAGCRVCQDKARVLEKARTMGYRPTLRPAAPSMEKLRALRAAGYDMRLLSRETGLSAGTIFATCNGKYATVTEVAEGAVNRAWERLKDFPGPSLRARNGARKYGWAPPVPLPMPEPVSEDDLDWVNVERVVRGDRTVCLTRAEQLAAWEVLEGKGLSAERIGRTLGVTERTIQRLRSGATVKPYPRRTG